MKINRIIEEYNINYSYQINEVEVWFSCDIYPDYIKLDFGVGRFSLLGPSLNLTNKDKFKILRWVYLCWVDIQNLYPNGVFMAEPILETVDLNRDPNWRALHYIKLGFSPSLDLYSKEYLLYYYSK